MITLKNVRTLLDETIQYTIPSDEERIIDVEGRYVVLPGLIDTHFYCENQKSSVFHSAVKGGITSIINSYFQPSLHEKCCYAPAHAVLLEDFSFSKQDMKGVLLEKDIFNEEEWKKIFRFAAWKDIPVVMELEEEGILLDKVFHYAEQQSTRLYLLNVKTPHQLEQIKRGKQKTLLIDLETTPQHLFGQKDTQHLWQAIEEGQLDIIGSGYRNEENLSEVFLFQNQTWSLLDPLFLLPQLLTACHKGKMSIEKMVRLTRVNVNAALNFEKNHDVVLVDLEQEHVIQKKTPIEEQAFQLKGWPVYSIVKGKVIACGE